MFLAVMGVMAFSAQNAVAQENEATTEQTETLAADEQVAAEETEATESGLKLLGRYRASGCLHRHMNYLLIFEFFCQVHFYKHYFQMYF